jgi:deazaflavin-dependent oxidoreductase (nitroreductase family)
MAMRRALARFNKKVTNRVQGLWAPWLPPWAVIVHKGRNTGRSYSTPVLAFRSGGQLCVILFYGTQADWLRNVLAAGSAEVRRAGKPGRLANPRVVDRTDPAIPSPARALAGRRSFLLVEYSDAG